MSIFKIIGVLYVLCLAENLIVRLILTFQEWTALGSPLQDLLKILAGGLYHDTLFFGYFAAPLVFFFLILPKAFWNSRASRVLVHTLVFLIAALFSFQAHAEWFFWGEFHSRFNFIAVDYLVYTQEVIGNIVESYPMGRVYASILLTSALIYLAARPWLARALSGTEGGMARGRWSAAGLMVLAPLSSFYVPDLSHGAHPGNQIVEQLSRNGFYQFVSAFRHNRLDYRSFYPVLENEKVLNIIQRDLASANSAYTGGGDLGRMISNPGPEKRYNVVFIAVESLSADFLGYFGNENGLTPNLDRLAGESMMFTRLYATGTRTVRGLEAITLSIPPTPGYSVVKRPHNENLFSLGSVLRSKGYETKFIYGGYGYFDNMNYFFENNGFQVIDRTDFAAGEIDFANIWGVSDGSLFTRALREADASHKGGQPFFQFLMTTSNHRPYTYPGGLIDIPSRTGRKGGVKYTDYAIGKFIDSAREKPWFGNTLFVIIADHCAGGRGLTSIPMQNYHIPALIYAPGIIRPQVVDRLASQIDIVPTLFGLLNFSYFSKFMGKDILKMTEQEERALMATYADLGYYRRGTLVTLPPLAPPVYERVDPGRDHAVQASPAQPEILNEGIGYYQFADHLLTQGLYQSAAGPAS